MKTMTMKCKNLSLTSIILFIIFLFDRLVGEGRAFAVKITDEYGDP